MYSCISAVSPPFTNEMADIPIAHSGGHDNEILCQSLQSSFASHSAIE